jgi:hypothetical protein
MRIISTTVTIIEVADNGQASILESKTTVEKMPETISQKKNSYRCFRCYTINERI